MAIEATMTGSWFRPPQIVGLLKQSPTGEIDPEAHREAILQAERQAISDQLHPLGAKRGLYWVSNGEQRKAGYTFYLPNRFAGFSGDERSPMSFSREFLQDMQESTPAALESLQQTGKAFALPVITSPLEYTGRERARREASDARELAKELGAPRIFLPSPSPGVITIFYSAKKEAYKDHSEFVFGAAKEMRKEFEAILSVEGVDLQIDAPDLAMGKQLGTGWGGDFYDVIRDHVDAINEAVAGLDKERIRVHYCYGNYLASHRFDADFKRILPEILRLNVGTIVGEMANGRHEGDALTVRDHAREHGWPKGLKFAVGVIDVKTPFVETPRTVALRLDNMAKVEEIDPDNLFAGTDCGFETFAGMANVTKAVALRKLEALAKGAELESKRLGLD